MPPILNIIAKINQYFIDFDQQQSLFTAYIPRIKAEESKFDEDLRNLFKKKAPISRAFLFSYFLYSFRFTSTCS